ncbi:hypothetical protein POX_a00314 [Penicillium oxalicum]|uniref:Uncharacterized protein n=1 Tax=Penicillium oxalicum (strain 114-2 / CGMCC 5302) TaxID=933388 RepID=S8A0Q4_PENO1|nr:hypothetical protein POX_a00314 [Penicillium oxalicum]EPS34716.1 hypothetical protein PDE_09680 [Penicillium oxalicum 114-2]KAI2793730.1 hypothetical protein POX_a00314 [Penicillium oxalicum]
MACPITVSKFVGTVSLGLLTGLSYSTASITIPALQLLPKSSTAARCLNEVKRLSRKQALRFSSLANTCLLFAYFVSPPRRQHPFLIWMCVVSTAGAYGVDIFANRHLGLKNWFYSTIYDTTCLSLGGNVAAKKEEDLVVVESEDDVNGESVRLEMKQERRLQRVRTWLTGIAFTMGVVGLWGDKK